LKTIEEQRKVIRQKLKQEGKNVSLPKRTKRKFLGKKKVKKKKPKKGGKDKLAKKLRRIKYKEYLKSKKWRDFKNALLKARGNCCEKCGQVKPLDAHHMTYKRLFNELPEDILLVCRPCHQKIHGRKF
jgi:hypothetical protein